MYNEERPFLMHRREDISGVSGTGLVAHGVRHADGTATVWWFGKWPTETRHRSMESVIGIHGHGGRTEIRWCDFVNGQWTIPFQEGFFAWCTDLAHTPMSRPGWVFMMTKEFVPRWHGLAFNTFVPTLTEGDFLFAVSGPDGAQLDAEDGPASDRLTLVQLLASTSCLYVSRILPETGGAPAAVRIKVR
jgi:hypothetical protein